jgi:hypothetical protein
VGSRSSSLDPHARTKEREGIRASRDF